MTADAASLLDAIEPCVRANARMLARRVPPAVATFEDLYQTGMLQAVRLANAGGYDRRRGAITTWAGKAVAGAMLDYLREVGRAGAGRASLSERFRPCEHDGGSERDNVHEPADDGPLPEDLAETAEERVIGVFRPLTQVLTPDERKMLGEHLVRGRFLRQIGEDRGVCESRACQMWNGLMAKLRERAEELGGYRAVAAMAN